MSLMTEIFTAATLEEAKQKAAEAFGAAVSDIRFTVIEEPKRSLLGGLFGKKPAEVRVEAVYEPAAEIPAAEIPAVPAEEIAPAAEAPAEVIAAEDAEEENAPVSEDPAANLEKMKHGMEYLEKVLAQLAPEVKAEAKLGQGVEISLTGNGAGGLIGKRGETLDALQYLTSMVANRSDREYLRITIDTCGYREKRRKALQELAQRISKTVLQTGTAMSLEPMNPYERRIIHSTVTEIEGVSSHSAGEEPNRKVIITSDANPLTDDSKAKPFRTGSDRTHGGRFHKQGDRDRDRGRAPRKRGDRRPSGEGPRKLDLSTSFEKDYKRPKPEDSINTGVYGKIDI